MKLITLIKEALQNEVEVIEIYDGTKHPQEQMLLEKHKGHKEALEAVLAALRGDTLPLKLL